MTFGKILIVVFVLQIVGVFIGLVIRLIRENINGHFLAPSFWAAIKCLIIYPLLMPFFIFNNKEFFAELIIKNDGKATGKSKRAKSNRDRLKRSIIRNLTIGRIIKIWLRFLRSVAKDFDDFVVFNMNFIKDAIENSKQQQKTKVLIVPTRKNSIIEKQCNLFGCLDGKRIRHCS